MAQPGIDAAGESQIPVVADQQDVGGEVLYGRRRSVVDNNPQRVQ
jgi:hypothetical protein